MQYWKVQAKPLSGSSYSEVKRQADFIFSLFKKKTKRKPYIKSKYFGKRKIFFDYFWDHLFQKPKGQRINRIRLIPLAIELIEHNTYPPSAKTNPNKTKEKLFRFYGKNNN